MAVAVERFLHVQEVFCEVLLEENEVIENEIYLLCCSNHSEDYLLFFSKKAMLLTAYDSNVNRPKMKTGSCPLFLFSLSTWLPKLCVVYQTKRRSG